MEALLLVIAALFAAVLGLWGWRRLSRTTRLETDPPPAPAAPSHLRVQVETREEEPQPCEAHAGPPSPPPTAHVTAPAVSVVGGGESNSAEVDLPPANAGEMLSETADQGAVPETDSTFALPVGAGANQDGAIPLPALSETADRPCTSIPAVADGADDPEEEALADDHPGADPVGTTAGTEPLTDDTEVGRIPSALEQPAPESPARAEAESNPGPARDTTAEPPGTPRIRHPKQPTVHRDRRGKRRTVRTVEAPGQPAPAGPAPATRPPAEAKLRLSLHPIRRTARLSIVLTRPEGFPQRVTIQAAGDHPVEAYDEQRYDDLDLPWTSALLCGELRLASSDGFKWLRSARQVYIFAEDPDEPELISVSAARAGIAHTLACSSSDAEAIRLAAASTGSPELQTHEYWQGIPDGWLVLSGYAPVRAAVPPLPAGLRPLDPGEGLEISFAGGLAIRARVYAAGHSPRISITPAPREASVTIGGVPATLTSDGTWVAPGWDTTGQHMVDVVPGPSASYEIAADPWMADGWEFWDAYPERFGDGEPAPWARAQICGAQIRGPAEESVFAAEAQPTLIALGASSGATPLRLRNDVAVSVGLMGEPPAFLLSATGQRRTQGRVIWLGLAPTQNISRRHDAKWVATVRMAATRRLPLDRADALGEDAWQKAKERARQLRRRLPRE